MFIYIRITILIPKAFSSSKFGCKKRRKYEYFSTFAEKTVTAWKPPPPTLTFRHGKRRKNVYF